MRKTIRENKKFRGQTEIIKKKLNINSGTEKYNEKKIKMPQKEVTTAELNSQKN